MLHHKIPDNGFKNIADGFHPQFREYSEMHAGACRKMRNMETPDIATMRKCAEIIRACESKFPLLREFRQAVPEVDEMVEDLLVMFPN